MDGNTIFWLVSVLMELAILVSSRAVGSCPRNYTKFRFDNEILCVKCPPCNGSGMEPDRNCNNAEPYEISSPVEAQVACVHCKEGFFNRNGRCHKCDEPCENKINEITTRDCTKLRNRICMCEAGFYHETHSHNCIKRCSACITGDVSEKVAEGECLAVPENLRCIDRGSNPQPVTKPIGFTSISTGVASSKIVANNSHFPTTTKATTMSVSDTTLYPTINHETTQPYNQTVPMEPDHTNSYKPKLLLSGWHIALIVISIIMVLAIVVYFLFRKYQKRISSQLSVQQSQGLTLDAIQSPECIKCQSVVQIVSETGKLIKNCPHENHHDNEEDDGDSGMPESIDEIENVYEAPSNTDADSGIGPSYQGITDTNLINYCISQSIKHFIAERIISFCFKLGRVMEIPERKLEIIRLDYIRVYDQAIAILNEYERGFEGKNNPTLGDLVKCLIEVKAWDVIRDLKQKLEESEEVEMTRESNGDQNDENAPLLSTIECNQTPRDDQVDENENFNSSHLSVVTTDSKCEYFNEPQPIITLDSKPKGLNNEEPIITTDSKSKYLPEAAKTECDCTTVCETTEFQKSDNTEEDLLPQINFYNCDERLPAIDNYDSQAFKS